MSSSSSSAGTSAQQSLYQVQGRSFRPRKQLSANPAMHRSEFLPEHREKTLYIGGLDKRVTEYHLIQLYQTFGKIDRLQFMWHHVGEQKGQPRGYAFIEFTNKLEAIIAQKSTDGKLLGGRRLVVRFAEERESPNDVSIDYKSVTDRRKIEIKNNETVVGVKISTHDKIRAIEEKLKRMNDQVQLDKDRASKLTQNVTTNSSSKQSSSTSIGYGKAVKEREKHRDHAY